MSQHGGIPGTGLTDAPEQLRAPRELDRAGLDMSSHKVSRWWDERSCHTQDFNRFGVSFRAQTRDLLGPCYTLARIEVHFDGWWNVLSKAVAALLKQRSFCSWRLCLTTILPHKLAAYHGTLSKGQLLSGMSQEMDYHVARRVKLLRNHFHSVMSDGSWGAHMVTNDSAVH